MSELANKFSMGLDKRERLIDINPHNSMYTKNRILPLLAGFLLLTQSAIFAAVKTYQVTGPIVELTDKMIVVQKGDERWEIARDETSKVKGDLKVGQKVTVTYRMTATTIEAKPAASSPPAKSNK